jgi:hypothetical protein
MSCLPQTLIIDAEPATVKVILGVSLNSPTAASTKIQLRSLESLTGRRQTSFCRDSSCRHRETIYMADTSQFVFKPSVYYEAALIFAC